MTLSRLGTRFLDPDVEHRFRLDSLPQEARLGTAIQSAWVAVFVAFAWNDFLLHRGALLVALVLLRVLVVGSGLLLILFLHRSRDPRRRDLAFLAVIVVEVLFGIVSNQLRPPQVAPLFATNVVGILTCWALLPLPARLQALSAGFVTAAAVLMIALRPMTLHPVEVVRLTLELVLANGVGAGVSVISNRERRARWAAVQAADEASRALLATQRELTDARVKEIQSQLIQVQRAGGMGSLAVSLAHELGQPLTAVRNNVFAARAYLDRSPPDVAKLRSALEDVGAGADRAAAIIQRTRAYLRRGDVLRERVDPVDLTRQAVELVRQAAGARGTEVAVDVAEGTPAVLGDRVQLVQVAVIALVNALDAVQDVPGPRRVTLWARPGPSGVDLGVDDTGPGIPPAVADRLFDPFFTTKRDGLGMGLPIARTIVEAHGGSIAADSAPGGGARISWSIAAG